MTTIIPNLKFEFLIKNIDNIKVKIIIHKKN